MVQPSMAYPLPSQFVLPNGNPTVPLASLRLPVMALVMESEVRNVFWAVGGVAVVDGEFGCRAWRRAARIEVNQAVAAAAAIAGEDEIVAGWRIAVRHVAEGTVVGFVNMGEVIRPDAGQDLLSNMLTIG